MNGNTKKCAQCGKEIEALKSTKKYCSDACKQAAFYVRNAQSLTSDNANTDGNSIQEIIVTSRRIYCYAVTIGLYAGDNIPYYEESTGSVIEQQHEKATEPLFPATIPLNTEEPLQTVSSIGIYGTFRPGIYFQTEYKQVIPVSSVNQSSISSEELETVQAKKALNALPKFKQQRTIPRRLTDKHHRQTNSSDKPFTVTKKRNRIREPTLFIGKRLKIVGKGKYDG